MTTTLLVTVDVDPEGLPLLMHELVETENVLTVLEQATPAAPAAQDAETLSSLIAAAEVAADHYRDEAEYFEREGEQEAVDSFADLEHDVRDVIARAQSLATPTANDPLLAKIEQLLDKDPTGVIRDTLWDLVENS